MKRFTIILCIVFLQANLFAQIPTVKAIGGDGRNISWAKEQQKYQNEIGNNGPGYFYCDCCQGVTPIKASSTLKGQGTKNYSIKNISDNNPMTAWVEGVSGYGLNEGFEIKGMANVIYNGYQSSPTNWKNNSRVKKFKILANGKPLCYLELTDEMGSQQFDLPFKPDNYEEMGKVKLVFIIVDVYKGLKWDDVAISGLDYKLCCFGTDTYISINQKQIRISEIKKGNDIECIDIDNNKVYKSKVNSVVSVEHINLVKISTNTKTLTLTKEHPINIKDYGFISLSILSSKLNLEMTELVNNNILILTWDKENKVTKYEQLTNLEIIEGKQKTYSIRDISKGENYIVNGIITSTY